MATNATQNAWAYSRGESWAVLSMSEFRLGHTAAARADLAQCEKVVQLETPSYGSVLGYDWRDWIIAHALLAEAQDLIERQTASNESLHFQQAKSRGKHE